jgi:hypothetical protein
VARDYLAKRAAVLPVVARSMLTLGVQRRLMESDMRQIDPSLGHHGQGNARHFVGDGYSDQLGRLCG